MVIFKRDDDINNKLKVLSKIGPGYIKNAPGMPHTLPVSVTPTPGIFLTLSQPPLHLPSLPHTYPASPTLTHAPPNLPQSSLTLSKPATHLPTHHS